MRILTEQNDMNEHNSGVALTVWTKWNMSTEKNSESNLWKETFVPWGAVCVCLCVLTFGFLLGSCSVAQSCVVPTWELSGCSRAGWNFFLPGQRSYLCVQVLTYLGRVVMKMLHRNLLILEPVGCRLLCANALCDTQEKQLFDKKQCRLQLSESSIGLL